MIYVIIIFSMLFESAFSNIVNLNTFLVPLFLLTSLVILYPYFKNKKINFIIVCTVCGFLYDIILTNSSFINTLSFGIVGSLIEKPADPNPEGSLIVLCYNYINYNIYSSNFLNIIMIILYRIISYLILCIIDFIKFNEMDLLESIYNSLLVNVVYGIIIYIIIDLLSKIFNIKRIE